MDTNTRLKNLEANVAAVQKQITQAHATVARNRRIQRERMDKISQALQNLASRSKPKSAKTRKPER